MDKDESVTLSFDQAVALLPDGDEVHTFLNPGGILVGANWPREKILEVIKEHGAEVSGDQAQRMKHGIVITQYGSHGPLFIETKSNVL